MTSSLDSDLLFALLSIRAGGVDLASMRAAMAAWSTGGEKSLGEILIARGAIDEVKRLAIERLAADPSRAWPSIRYSEKRHHRTGGVGRVWKATDSELHRDVAFKDLRDDCVDDPVRRSQFLLEAELTGRLEHPGVVPVYGRGTDALGRPFYATKFIEGRELEAAIDDHHRADDEAGPGERSLRLRDLINRLIAVCQTVSYAHSRGVVHRDIKPRNILLEQYGETLLVDWGLARALGDVGELSETDATPILPTSGAGSSVTLSGDRTGTMGYLAPEYVVWGRIGPAGDVYALGAVLYTILVGRPPIGDLPWPIFVAKLAANDIPRPRQLAPEVPRALEAVCLKAIETDPADRHATAAAFADDLTRWLADEPVSAFVDPFSARAGRWVRRHKPAVAGAAMFLIAAVAVLSASLVVIAGEKLRSERSFQVAGAAIKGTIAEFASSEVSLPALDCARERLAIVAISILTELERQRPADPTVRGDLVEIARGVGELQRISGHLDEALRSFGLAIRLNDELTRDFPDDPDRKGVAIELARERASCWRMQGKLKLAEDEIRRAIDAAEQGGRLSPILLIVYRQTLADILAESGQLDEARELADAVAGEFSSATRVALPNDPLLSYLMMTRILQGRIAREQDRSDDAISTYRAALKELEGKGLKANTASLKSSIEANLAAVLLGRNESTEAARLAGESSRRLREVMRDHSHILLHRLELAYSLFTHGEAIFMGDPARRDEARARVEEGLELLRGITGEPANRPEVLAAIPRGDLILGRIALSGGEAEKARGLLSRAKLTAKAALDSVSERPGFRRDLESILREIEAISPPAER